MLRGLLAALVTTWIAWFLFKCTGALSNEGLLDGKEAIVIVVVCIVSALTYWSLARTVEQRPWLLWSGALAALLVVPFLVFLGPVVFCIVFMPNTPCL